MLPRVNVVTKPGEDRDLADFYAATAPRLVRMLTVATGSGAEAEELAHDAFVKLLPRWDQVRRYEDPEGWVRSVALRLMISRSRRARVARLGLQKLQAQQPPSSLDPSSLAMNEMLAQLPVPQRAVVVLHYLLDQPVDKVAEELQIPVGTVKSRLSRARATLRPLLTDDQETPHHA